MTILSNDLYFPDPSLSNEDGLVAIGGDLSVQRLLLAYKNGIFPWETEPVIAWYSPDPRCILFPEDIKISKSMKTVINSGKFRFQINTAFEKVINACKINSRKGVIGSWISDPLIKSFITLFEQGFAYSAETWQNGNLVGGLYGLKIGSVFFGESMFSTTPNASKFALIKLCKYLKANNISMIDCQAHSAHLESLGAILIPRADFLQKLKLLVPQS